MHTYKNYLEKNGYTIKSINTYLKTKTNFNDWCYKYGTTAEEIDYKTFLKYIEHLKVRRLKPRTQNAYISNLKIYFNYLVETNKRFENVIKNINIKGVKQEVIHNILTSEELEDLYYSYPANNIKSLSNKRNKIIVGLLVYQGLTTSNLNNIKVENIQLYKGKIDILGRANSYFL